eukprot:GHVS01058395.1.p1 GENE.GHVS01058395.1~~GHVS01058395.1.p1  ORF type:complete len:1152 (-),score=117.00 GHVS01058395.1:1462-4917(-)
MIGRYISGIEKLLCSGCYFSYDIDITTSLQRKHKTNRIDGPAQVMPRENCDSLGCMLDVVDESFWWNQWMALNLLDRGKGICKSWIVPIMQGHISYARMDRNGSSLELLLICRRSCKRGGTRYNNRGIDDNGFVANFAESEQLVRLNAKQGWCSLMQIRGSVPVFWEQTGLTAQTSVTRSSAMTCSAFRKHQEHLHENYGDYITYVNLLSHSKANEFKLTRALYEQLHLYHVQEPHHPRLHHIEYDFHSQVKARGFEESLSEFIEKELLDAASKCGFFCTGDKRYQKGVLRTNCLDCLDRTNVFQWYFCWVWLAHFLRQYKMEIFQRPIKRKDLVKLVSSWVLPSGSVSVDRETPAPVNTTMTGKPTVSLHGSGTARTVEVVEVFRESPGPGTEYWEEEVAVLKDVFRRMWADQGDSISVQYTGTGSVLSAVMKQGRATFSTSVDHAFKSLGRFYHNTFEDNLRQECLDIILGYHRVCRKANDELASPTVEFPIGASRARSTSRGREAIQQDSLALRRSSSDVTRPGGRAEMPAHTIGVESEGKGSSKESRGATVGEETKMDEGWGEDATKQSSGDRRQSSTKEHAKRVANLSVWVGTWNVAGRELFEEYEDLDDWLTCKKELADVYVFCIQEMVELTSVRVIFSMKDKDKETRLEEKLFAALTSVSKSPLLAHAASSGMGNPPASHKYKGGTVRYLKVRSCCMVGLYIVVYIKEHLKDHVTGVDVSSVKGGLKGNAGNKGAVCIRFIFGDTSLCLGNVHLASGHNNGPERVQQMQYIMGQGFLSSRCHYMGIQDHDYVVLGGDFNFRVNKSHDEVVAMLNAQREQELINDDQYIISRKHHLSPFGEWHEAPLKFRPTYKYRRNSNFYDLKRTPAWCDRVLYGGKRCPLNYQHAHGHRSNRHRAAPQPHSLKVLDYRDHNRYFTSDHKPVSAFLTIPVVLRQSMLPSAPSRAAHTTPHCPAPSLHEVSPLHSPAASSSKPLPPPESVAPTSASGDQITRSRAHRRHYHYHPTTTNRKRSSAQGVSSVGEQLSATSSVGAGTNEPRSSCEQPHDGLLTSISTQQTETVDLLGLHDEPPIPFAEVAETLQGSLRSERSADLLNSLLTTGDAIAASATSSGASDWTLVDLPETQRDTKKGEKRDSSADQFFDLL